MTQLEHIINSDSSLRDWREKTAKCFIAIGMPEEGIITAIQGGFDNPSYLKNYCKIHKLDFNYIWKKLKL